MKVATITAILAPAAVANAEWWGGAPGCAATCMSQAWNDANSWPSATSFCASYPTPTVAACVEVACAATPTAWSSFSAMSSNVCSQWSSCTNAGPNNVRTITATGGTWGGGWFNDAARGWDDASRKEWEDKWKSRGGPGGPFPWKRDGPGHFGPGGPKALTSGQVYTVTGCDWNDGYWGGFGWGAGFGGPWGMGTGWTALATSTGLVTRTITTNGAVFTTTEAATIGVAVSGGVTTTSTFGFAQAQATGTSDAGRVSANGVKIVGAVLGGVVGVAALL
ncbi:hypothetical protein PspLS_07867 [Pyricularia sp. CBS 133598]|nr:hypothetical protein PspLS_07867 [Pyricularia sp. CBS 133598]